MRIETTILSNLVYNEEYTRKVIPFLKHDYFSDHVEKTIFRGISSYVEKYNNTPSIEALDIDLQKIPQNEDQYKSTQNNVKMPEHIKRLELKQLEIKQEENNKRNDFNDHYRKDILDYYQDTDDEKEHPFKNTIKKYNSKGKFVLDLT